MPTFSQPATAARPTPAGPAATGTRPRRRRSRVAGDQGRAAPPPGLRPSASRLRFSTRTRSRQPYGPGRTSADSRSTRRTRRTPHDAAADAPAASRPAPRSASACTAERTTCSGPRAARRHVDRVISARRPRPSRSAARRRPRARPGRTARPSASSTVRACTLKETQPTCRTGRRRFEQHLGLVCATAPTAALADRSAASARRTASAPGSSPPKPGTGRAGSPRRARRRRRAGRRRRCSRRVLPRLLEQRRERVLPGRQRAPGLEPLSASRVSRLQPDPAAVRGSSGPSARARPPPAAGSATSWSTAPAPPRTGRRRCGGRRCR